MERERTRKLGESGWLHAPACEPRHSSTELLSKPWLHAPACEDSQPGSNFSTQHGAGRVERRQVPKCRWLHALACEHSQPGNSFQEEWTIQPAAQEETDKDPKARLAPRSGVRAKPAWQMDPEGRDGCTLRRAKTASQATTSQHNTALAGFKNVEREREPENLESQAGSTPQRANQGILPQSYCQSRGSTLRRAKTASPAATSQHNTVLAGLKDDKFLNAAGSTLRRANTASPAIVFTKNGPFSQQHKKRQTRIQKPGWLHAPACEPSQLGKWIQKAGMAARSGVRRQQARQQLLNTTRRWQGSKTWRETTRKLGESGWLHAPACEPRHCSTELLSKPWLHAPACEHSQPGNSFQEEWTIQPAAPEETHKDPKARLAPRSGVRAKPAWQMDPEGRAGSTLRRAKTASPALTTQR